MGGWGGWNSWRLRKSRVVSKRSIQSFWREMKGCFVKRSKNATLQRCMCNTYLQTRFRFDKVLSKFELPGHTSDTPKAPSNTSHVPTTHALRLRGRRGGAWRLPAHPQRARPYTTSMGTRRLGPFLPFPSPCSTLCRMWPGRVP
jgi:hypothetical protein